MVLLILLTILSGGFISPLLHTSSAGQTHPSWFIVFEEKPAQGDRVQFLRAQKRAADVWKQQNPEIPVLAWQNDDNTLYRILPIFSFASIDTLHQKMEQVSAIMNEGRWNRQEQDVNPSTVSGSVMVWEPELSNYPEAEFSLHSEEPYIQWMFVYLLAGHEEEATIALQNFRDYYIDNNLDYPWNTFRVLFGNKTPLLIGMFRAESPASLQEKGDKIWKKHGDRLQPLWEKVVRCTWKIENTTGWFNASLSNLPVIEPEEEVAGGL